MSIRTRVLGFVDVMMRVPPILVIDEILKIGMGIPTRMYPSSTSLSTTEFLGNATLDNATQLPEASGDSMNVNATTLLNDSLGNQSNTVAQAIENASIIAGSSGMLSKSFGTVMEDLAKDTNLADLLATTPVKFLFCLTLLLCAATVFMLWTRHLVMVYMFTISMGLTFLSYWSNVSALTLMENTPCILENLLSFNTTRLMDSGGIVMSLVPHLVAQWFMGMLFAYIHLGPRYAFLQKSMPYIFASPILLAMLPFPTHFKKFLPLLAGLVPLLLAKITLINSVKEATKTVCNGYLYAINFISSFGLSAFVENEWQRLNVPNVLRLFWTLRISQQFISVLINNSITTLSLLPTIQKLLIDGCETLTAVLGMTSIISSICYYTGRAFQWYLLAYDNDEEKSLGTVSAVLFYILALQTGLTSLAPEKRFVRLGRNLCLLVTAMFHFLHNIVSPMLMSLSAARNPSRKRHIRTLSVCAFLLLAPISLLTVLWSRHNASTWLLAVTAFSVEVIVKVLVSLATYTLFLLDARRQSFWEKLDDYLYYVRAFGNSVEFFFGILLFFNGAWILIFESGGAIRAIMMCIHAYFNIWCEARAGWNVFIKRRTAVHKISALPEATLQQLRDFDDVCAICYQDMFTAKITRCRHLFHGVCLRKWLYVQDRCPLCHEIMMYAERSDESNGRAAAHNAGADEQQHQVNNAAAAEMQRLLPAGSQEGQASSNSMSIATQTANEAITLSSNTSGGSASTSSSPSIAITSSLGTASSTSSARAAAVSNIATAAAGNTVQGMQCSTGLDAQD